MRVAIPPIPNTPSWLGALLSTGTTLPLPLPTTMAKYRINEQHANRSIILTNFIPERNKNIHTKS